MAWKKIDDTILTEIANAIRFRTGESMKITLDAMAEGIMSIANPLSVLRKDGTITIQNDGKIYYVDMGFTPDVMLFTLETFINKNKVTQCFGHMYELKQEGASETWVGSKVLVSNGMIGNLSTSIMNHRCAMVLEDVEGTLFDVELKYVALKFDRSEGGSNEQAAPTISVSASGLITATAGDKSTTKQLATKGTATITPGTSNQTIQSQTFLTGTQTIKGDANLKAENIKSGISIFGVAGSFAGSGGSGETKYNVSVKNSSSFEYTVCAGGSIVLIPTGQTKVVSVPIRSPIVAYDASYNNYPAGQIVGTGGITISGCFAFLNTAPSGTVSIDIKA